MDDDTSRDGTPLARRQHVRLSRPGARFGRKKCSTLSTVLTLMATTLLVATLYKNRFRSLMVLVPAGRFQTRVDVSMNERPLLAGRLK